MRDVAISDRTTPWSRPMRSENSACIRIPGPRFVHSRAFLIPKSSSPHGSVDNGICPHSPDSKTSGYFPLISTRLSPEARRSRASGRAFFKRTRRASSLVFPQVSHDLRGRPESFDKLRKVGILGENDRPSLPRSIENPAIFSLTQPEVAHRMGCMVKFADDPSGQSRRQMRVHPNHAATSTGWLSLLLAYCRQA